MRKQHWDEIFDALWDGIRRAGDGLSTLSRKQKLELDNIVRRVRDKDSELAGRVDLDASPLPRGKVREILATPKGDRPDPSTYMSKADIDRHLQPFRETGAVRFASRSGMEKYGTIGPADGTYIIPRSEFDSVLERSGGDLRKIEQELGLDSGQLGADDTIIAAIEPQDLQDLRMPNGNEAGANSQWLPGGYTSGGMPEATVNAPNDLEFSLITIGD